MDKQNLITDNELDKLLDEVDFAQVPSHFTDHVMASIEALPNSASSQRTWWQWLALIGGGIPSLMQIIAFVFSAWNMAAIG